MASLRDQTFHDFETILICIEIDDKIRMISLEYGARLFEDKGKGRCYARNLGITKAKGDILVFLDDDVALMEDWLEIVVEEFKSNPKIGGVGGIPITAADDRLLSRIFSTVYNSMMIKLQGMSQYSNFRSKTDFLSGSNMAFRKSIMTQIGGFDENFYGSSAGEDIEISLRVREKGYSLIFNPEAVAYHYSDFVGRTSVSHRDDPLFFQSLADNQTYWPVKHRLVKGLGWIPYLLFRLLNGFHWMIMTRNISVFFSYLQGIQVGRKRAINVLSKTLID